VAVVEIVPLALEVRTLAKGCVVATILIPVVIGDSKQAVFVDFRIIRLVDYVPRQVKVFYRETDHVVDFAAAKETPCVREALQMDDEDLRARVDRHFLLRDDVLLAFGAVPHFVALKLFVLHKKLQTIVQACFGASGRRLLLIRQGLHQVYGVGLLRSQ